MISHYSSDTLRNTGDLKADSFIKKELSSTESTQKLYAYLFKNEPNPSLIDTLKDYFSEDLNFIFHKKQHIRACDFYKKHRSSIGLLLAFYSLPYCYLAENGARVLAASQKLNKDPYKRLKDTGAFLNTVLNYDKWLQGDAQLYCLKIRLIHAFMRYKLLEHGWNQEWGIPLNLEDIIGTNLSFSMLIIKGLKKMGIFIDSSEEQAYLSLWHNVGILLGIPLEFPLNQMEYCSKIDKHISETQFRESVIGKELCKNLFEMLATKTNNTMVKNYLFTQSRTLLGPKYADWLGIPDSKIPNVFIKSIHFSSSIFSFIYD
jgi:hypothetical protein